jgi:GDP-L-fucose synthase
MTEDCLLTGILEPTNEPYAIAKIAGIKMCQAYRRQYGCNFISVMPTNLYGPGDNFNLETSHVAPAMLRKFHEARTRGAKAVTLWGTGTPRREFLHVADLADACVFLMHRYDEPEIVNIGMGKDISIKELGELIQKIVGFKGEIIWDTGKPEGTPRKLLDVSRLAQLGWQARISLEQGLSQTYQWYKEHYAKTNP